MRSHRLSRLAVLTQGVALVGFGLAELACSKDPPPNAPDKDGPHINAPDNPEPPHVNSPAPTPSASAPTTPTTTATASAPPAASSAAPASSAKPAKK